MTWRKGRVEKLVKGKDGLVRGAQIKVYQSAKDKITTITTTILRPLQLIVPLELYKLDSGPEIQEVNAPLPRRMAAVNQAIERLVT